MTDSIPCPICKGSGYGRDEGPNTKFCIGCEGDGEITQEQLAKYMDTPLFDKDDRGDWLYEQHKDKL